MKKNKKRNFIVLGIVIVLVACITIMLFQVKGEKKEVVETDQNSYRYIKVDGKDYRYSRKNWRKAENIERTS